MVEFALAGAHPGYQAIVPVLIGNLVDRYRHCPLRRVALYRPGDHDRSMGNEDQPGVIRLNGYWLEQDPAVLQRKAMTPPFFHGPMIAEPQHLLSHEFGHVLSDSYTDGWRDRALEYWQELTYVPERSPSLYALADIDELVGELFALVDLGFATKKQRSRLRHISGG